MNKQGLALIAVSAVLLVMVAGAGVWAAPKVWRRLAPPDPFMAVGAGSSGRTAPADGVTAISSGGAGVPATSGAPGASGSSGASGVRSDAPGNPTPTPLAILVIRGATIVTPTPAP